MDSTREDQAVPDTGPVEFLSPRRTATIFLVVALGLLLAALDQTIVGTALPTIVSDLGGGEHLSWVVTSYLLAETVTTAIAGKLGDLFGRKLIFQLSFLIFGIGSFFSGFADSMIWLVIWRAVQGIGGGGLMVTSIALIADYIPVRGRAKYQGILGSVFGVVTVAGPMVGGLFVDHLSWRWAFYINIPLIAIVLVVATLAMPRVRTAAKPVIDYLGIALLSLGVTGLTLIAHWGGKDYAWTSPTILLMAAGSVVALALFVFVELRAEEPVLPMRLFRNPVFTVGGILSFVVGFAMLGALSYLPTYMQYVLDISATDSGIGLLPMVLGLLGTSTLSGILVGRTGRYKIFPILGSVGIAVGLYLLSTTDAKTSFVVFSLYMLILGVGIGLAMQVLVTAVQNTSAYSDLGVSTASVTFLRSLGGAFGAAIFGTVYAGQLGDNLTRALAEHPLPPGVDPRVVESPQLLHQLPDSVAAPIIDAYADTFQVVFLAVVPVGMLALLISLVLKEVPLRGTSRASASDVGDGFGMPESGDRDRELERAVANVLSRESKTVTTDVLTRAGSTLSESDLWCLAQIPLRHVREQEPSVDAIAKEHRVPSALLAPGFAALETHGYLAHQGEILELTERGQEELTIIATAWTGWLTDRLSDWEPAEGEELETALGRIAVGMASTGLPGRAAQPA